MSDEAQTKSMQQAILKFLLSHWKEVLLLLLSVGIFFKMQSDINELQKAYDAARESYETQISGLQDIHKEEITMREKALQTYRDALDTLERQYREEQERIKERTEQRRETLTENHVERPTEVINEIQKQFGFEYVE
tara:strand:- start:20795 stop:21202 length:408 start_codon:yes stop_codon:yes gene_type:complete